MSANSLLLATLAVSLFSVCGVSAQPKSPPPVLKRFEPAETIRVTLPGPKTPPRTHANPLLPSDFLKDSAIFCQQRIGHWTKSDADRLFGDPLGDRPAYSARHVENGRIYAYPDPSKRYQKIELDFAANGMLRSVFAYPRSLTWPDCRRQWGSQVRAMAANHGRTFYSYLNRRVDVLVDSGGKVISLGFY
jgi:hypothetical protein